MRYTKPVQFRYAPGSTANSELEKLARVYLSQLQATLGRSKTGAMTRTGPNWTIRVSFALGQPIVDITTTSEEETQDASLVQSRFYFALFEMLLGTSPPTLGDNVNSIVLKADTIANLKKKQIVGAAKWFRDEDDETVYPSIGVYPNEVPRYHALHPFADRKGGHVVTCGWSSVSYMTDSARTVGVAVDGVLVTSAFVGSGFSTRCLSPKIIKIVDGNLIIFSFLSAPVAGSLRFIVAQHDIANNITSTLSSHDIARVIVAHPIFGFFYNSDCTKCCGVVLSNGYYGFEIVEVEYNIHPVDYSISSAVTTPSFSFTNILDYEAQIGTYYNSADEKVPVTIRTTKSITGGTLVDRVVSRSGIAEFFWEYGGGTVTYDPAGVTQTVEWEFDQTTLIKTCVYRGEREWITLAERSSRVRQNYLYDATPLLSFNEAGTEASPGWLRSFGLFGQIIGSRRFDDDNYRANRISYMNPQTGSYSMLRMRDTREAKTNYLMNEYSYPTWSDGSYADLISDPAGNPTFFNFSISCLSSEANPEVDSETEYDLQNTYLAYVVNASTGSFSIDVDSEDIPDGIDYTANYGYPFSLNESYVASNFFSSYLYLPRRHVPPAYESVEDCDTQAKYIDYLGNLLEYWGFLDKRIAKNESMSNGRFRIITDEQYANHLIGTGVMYEFVENDVPFAFIALNTYDGIRVFINNVDITSTLPAGGSTTFVPAGVM